MEHIALIVNILWQIWKARNEKVLQENRRLPIKIIQKAQVEWLEFQKANAKENKMSMPETTTAGTIQDDCSDSENQRVGILAMNRNNQLIAQRALKEFGGGNNLMDNVVAL